jgi:carbon storage regulator
MLILSRKAGESVMIGGGIVVTVTRVDGEVVRLGIQAPAEVPVHRQEVYDEIQRNNRQALTQRGRRLPRLPVRSNPCLMPPEQQCVELPHPIES